MYLFGRRHEEVEFEMRRPACVLRLILELDTYYTIYVPFGYRVCKGGYGWCRDGGRECCLIIKILVDRIRRSFRSVARRME
jgi:hypothetical protein